MGGGEGETFQFSQAKQELPHFPSARREKPWVSQWSTEFYQFPPIHGENYLWIYMQTS